MHPAYRAIVMARAQAAVSLATALGLVGHDSTRGELRELVLDELLRPLLPTDIGVGSGLVVSADNRSSRQQDIVIYDRRILPPLLVGTHIGIFPVESVAFTIEIKSRLDQDDLMAAHQSAREIHEMRHLTGHADEEGRLIPSPVDTPICSLLAFGTQLSATESIVQRYDRLRPKDVHTCLWSFCVVGTGYWYRAGRGDATHWMEWPDRRPLADLVGFMGGVLNTIPRVLRRRGQPRFGQYVLENMSLPSSGSPGTDAAHPPALTDEQQGPAE